MEQAQPPHQTNRTMGALLARQTRAFVALCQRVPDAGIALLGRLAIAAVFWQSGQTKVQGFVVDIVHGQFTWGWPQLSDSVVPLFAEEYRLPLLPPETAALLAAGAEHLFPVLLVLGLATRLSALALLGMTLTIQFLVYPGGYATHGTWAAVLLFLVARGPGLLALDHWIARRCVSADLLGGRQ